MNEALNRSWPVADLDPVRRLRALTASRPGAAIVEQIISAPPDEVWALVSDLERSVPRSEWHVRSLRVTHRDGERVEALVVGVGGVQDLFTGVLRPGWCWLQGSALYIGMAATPAPDGTRFALAAGLRLPGARALRPLVRWGIARSLRRLMV